MAREHLIWPHTLPRRIDKKYEVLKSLGNEKRRLALLAKNGARKVVIKSLNSVSTFNPDKTLQRFKKEFLTLKKLEHPYIGKLHDFGFDASLKRHYFVGDYITGEDIAKTCLKATPANREKLFVQALQALYYLHTYSGAGLRHNDIKPENMLVEKQLSGRYCLKLIDFGLASFRSLSIRGGTPVYMAPEQVALNFPVLASGKKYPRPDHRADLYSLGIVWYQALTGINPFAIAQDYQTTLKRQLRFTPQPPSNVNPKIPTFMDRIILKLLKKNPEERYFNAAEVIRDLNLLGGKSYPVISSPLRRDIGTCARCCSEAWITIRLHTRLSRRRSSIRCCWSQPFTAR